MKTAVFFDLENVLLPSKNGELEKNFAMLMDKIKNNDLVDEIILKRAYVCKSHNALAAVQPIMKKFGVELVLVESLSAAPFKKANLVDFKMGVDASNILARKRSIKTVVVASGDNDFGFLCQHIKELGKNLIVASSSPTTGNSLLLVCDDWIDLANTDVSPKFVQKAIETRLTAKYENVDFILAFESFLKSMRDDFLLRRLMTNFGLPYSMFVSILHRRGIKFPSPQVLGFPNITAFIEVLLSKTGFKHKAGVVKYIGASEGPLSQLSLIEHFIKVPEGYTKEKLFKYYDILAAAENIDEFEAYIAFMRQAGIITNKSTLHKKRTFKAAVRSKISQKMEDAGITPDEKSLKKFTEKL